jgi:type I restriction enzyme S subunit
MIEAFGMPLPPLHEQKAIASVLGVLDDKIELNRKMNETLEAMARAIFKSWFVDFDPIPGLGPHKEWQDSPLGKIPKGWRVGALG